MKRFQVIGTCWLALGLVLALILGSCQPAETPKLKVVTSTAQLAQIAQRVGGEKVAVVNIIPPAQCPGHFDVKPGDIQKLADANLFLMHGWQGEKFSQSLIASANNPHLIVVKIDLPGNWMTPPIQLQATENITATLSQVDAKNSAAYQRRAGEYKDRIRVKEAELKAKLAKQNLASINVICAEQQAGFVKWVGLNVVAVYGQPETLTPQIVKGLVDKGRATKVSLIIDNVQSGQDAGKGVAEELGIKRVVISNFPGCFEGTETWEKTIDHNIELILATLTR